MLFRNNIIQTCIKTYENLQNGTFGKVSEGVIEDYRKRCGQLFPLATVFQDNQSVEKINEVVSSLNKLSVK